MSNTKNEHYVPRGYLVNFEGEDKRIKVFDKIKLHIRPQLKENIASENYFYDINFKEFINKIEPEKIPKLKKDIMKITGINNWDEIISTVLNTKYIEDTFLSDLDNLYAPLLKTIINKSYGGNDWVIKNCSPFSEDDKLQLSLFLAVQIMRTKSSREDISEIIGKTAQYLIKRQQSPIQNLDSDESLNIVANKDFVKLQHSAMLLDEKNTLHMSETLMKHIWVMYVNKTDQPFYTSDNPISTIPHKHNQYISYGGFNSEGVEIVFPLSPSLLIAMYESSWHSSTFKDRSFIPIYDRTLVDYYNQAQVINSYRCVYSKIENFELAKKLCSEHPEIRDPQNRIKIN